MGFYKNINAVPRIGSVIIQPDGFSIYTENGWQKFAEDNILNILDNARVVEKADGSRVDIDDVLGGHISDERVFYELVLRGACPLSFSQFVYMCDDGQMRARYIAVSTERLILDQHETYIRGWFSNYDFIRDVFEKYPSNIEYYMERVIKYLQKLKSEGESYKYIDVKYMNWV